MQQSGKKNPPSQHLFSMVPSTKIQRSQFIKQQSHKTTFDESELIPFWWDEVLPGDTFNVQATLMARLATPFVPIMDNLYMDTFFFFVPRRLTWSHWENFMGAATPNTNSTTDYTEPQTTATDGVQTGDLWDYFGVPIKVDGLTFNCCLGRSYALIWDEWFRDENLQDTVFNNGFGTFGDGPDEYAQYTVLARNKRHDYFTSCLPWPQKGPSVNIPLGGAAPVGNLFNYTDSDDLAVYPTMQIITMLEDGTVTSPLGGSTGDVGPVTDASGQWTLNAWNEDDNEVYGSTYPETDSEGYLVPNSSPTAPLSIGVPFGGLTADLGAASAATINELRQAFQVQKLYERDARGGTRYTEILRAHFGVVSPDARLQRPEYLGGQSVPIIINPVVQTSGSGITDQDTPQGNLAAFGVVTSHGNGFVKSFVEHGFVIGLVNIRGPLSYQQGLSRALSRQTRLDHYWPELSHIGEQAVLNQEIYAQGPAGDGADEDVFGYQERYAEYRYSPNYITGQFRSTATDPLDIWHLGYDYTALPVLGWPFIEDKPPVSRVVAVEDEPHFIFDSITRNICARPMPTYGVPGYIDHF